MSRYIDADAIDYDFYWNTKGYSIQECQRAEQLVNEQPTADVIDVVRCRDCTWWKSIFSWNGKEHKVCVRDASEPPREQNDFCSYGERREDAEAVNTKN